MKSGQTAIDNANKLAVTPDDLKQSQDRQDMLSLQQGLSAASSKIGNIGGQAGDDSFAKYLQSQVQGEKDALKQRQDAFTGAQGQVQQSLKGLGEITDQQQQEALNPLKLQAQQQSLQQGSQNLQKGAYDLKDKEADFAAQQSLRDPNSQESNALRALAKQLGVPGNYDGLNGEQLMKLTPTIEKAGQAILNRQANQLKQKELQQLKQDAKDTKATAEQEKTYQDAMQKTDPADVTGRKQLGRQQETIDAAKKLEGLIYDASHKIRPLTGQETYELAIAMNKMLGGSNAAGAIEHLVPKTAGMDWNAKLQYILGKPRDAGVQAFTEYASHTIQREKEIAEDVIRQAQLNTLQTYDGLKKSNPELFQKILEKRGFTPEEYETQKLKPRQAAHGADSSTGTQQAQPRRVWTPGG
jgi:hypothetical protein